MSINTLPVEMFLEKAKVARKSGQKNLVLTINESTMLEESLALIMTKLASDLDQQLEVLEKSQTVNTVQMDGGSL